MLLGVGLLLAGLNACSKQTLDYLTSDSTMERWVQVQPAGSYEDARPSWIFLEDGTLYIFDGGCVAHPYSYTVKGKTLEILPHFYSSEAWEKPFTFRILECTESTLRLKLLSIPEDVTIAGLSASTDIIELERVEPF